MKKNDELIQFLAGEFDRSRPNDTGLECPDENLWARLADGLIAGGEREELIRHIAHCPECRRRTSQILNEIDEGALSHLPATTLIAPESWLIRFRPWVLALAASIVLAVGVSLFYTLNRSGPADYGVSTRGMLLAQADLSELGIEPGRGIARAEGVPTMEQAAYRQALTKLKPYLDQSSPPSDALALATRAALSARFINDAIGYAEKWTQVAPADSGAWNSLGLARFQKNHFAEALQAFQKAIELDPNMASFYLNAALAADQADQPTKAGRYLTRFIQLASNHPEIDKAKKWLTRLEKNR
ncbi:MAG: tetratricopeptide repeat protein [Phycisphaerae bacterium]